MKGTPLPMLIEMASPMPRLAFCWKVTQRPEVGGLVMAWTNHDTPLYDPIDGLTYVPVSGGSQSDIVADVSMQAANMNVSTSNVAPNPSLDTVRAGDWDYGATLIFQLCWADTSKGRHILGEGTIGQVSVTLSEASIEQRGLLNALSQSIGDLTQAGCRHRLGDGAYLEGGCNNDGTIDPEYYSITDTVSDISDDGMVVDIDAVTEGSPVSAGGAYAYGRVKALGGLNAGRSRDIKSSGAGTVTLHEPFPYPLIVGTAVQVYEGCDGKRETCRDRFNNIYNLDGEPYLPGTDKMMKVPRS